jgi:hypothetical protein
MTQSQIKREESLKRQAWVRYRSWSRVTNGVLLSVIGAVQYGTAKVFYKTCIPHIVVRVEAAVFVKTYPLAMLTLIGGYV